MFEEWYMIGGVIVLVVISLVIAAVAWALTADLGDDDEDQ